MGFGGVNASCLSAEEPNTANEKRGSLISMAIVLLLGHNSGFVLHLAYCLRKEELGMNLDWRLVNRI